MTADARAQQYEFALGALLDSKEVDGAMVIATPTGTLNVDAAAQAMISARRRTKKPVIACLFGLSDVSNEVAPARERRDPIVHVPGGGDRLRGGPRPLS